MKMKSQRKVDRDRAKREASRQQVRAPSESDGDDLADETDLEVTRAIQGYDE